MGGLYFWVCKMKPDTPALGCKSVPLQHIPIYNVFQVCTGWIYTIAMVLTGTSGNLRYSSRLHPAFPNTHIYESVALYIASLIEIGQQISLSRVEIAAIAWGINILSGLLNTVGTKAIGRMSSFNMWWTIGGTFVLVITLLVKAPEKVCSLLTHVLLDLNEMFPRIQLRSYSRITKSTSLCLSNQLMMRQGDSFTGWSSKGFVVLLGFLQAGSSSRRSLRPCVHPQYRPFTPWKAARLPPR